MSEKRYRLLIVDAPGGPSPSVYIPMLPKDFEVRVVLVKPEKDKMFQQRLSALEKHVKVYVVEDRCKLKQEVERIASLFGAQGLLAFSERVVHDVNEVAYRLGLPSNSEQTQQALQNKELQRETLSKGGVATPKIYKIEGSHHLQAAAKYVGFPAVLKPVIGIGSLSTYDIQSMKELEEVFELATTIYQNDARVHGSPHFLLEKKLIGTRWHEDERYGDHVSVESLVSHGNILHLTVTDKLPLVFPFRETGDVMPSFLPEFRLKSIYEEAERAIQLLGIEVGAVHSEIKLTTDGPRIIEVNGRVGGGITEMLSFAANYNIVAELARIAVGIPPLNEPTFRDYCGFFTPQPPVLDIKLERVPSVSEIMDLPGVIEAEIVYPVGSEPNWRIGTGSNLARVIAVSNKREDILNLGTKLSDLSLFSYSTKGKESSDSVYRKGVNV